MTTLEDAFFVRETVPDEEVKSAGAEAEPGAVAQLTWSAQQAAGRGATWIVKLALTAAPGSLGHRDVGDRHARCRGRGGGRGDREEEQSGGDGPGHHAHDTPVEST